MSTKGEILVVVEHDNHPEIVAERGAWIARLCSCSGQWEERALALDDMRLAAHERSVS